MVNLMKPGIVSTITSAYSIEMLKGLNDRSNRSTSNSRSNRNAWKTWMSENPAEKTDNKSNMRCNMMDLAHKGMLNLKAAGKWDEAYPSGNGTQGVLVMGEPLDETIIFNHEGLFLPLPENAFSVLPDMSDDLPAVRKLIRERCREATGIFLTGSVKKAFRRK